jgi:DNA-binding NtrC family response regulator
LVEVADGELRARVTDWLTSLGELAGEAGDGPRARHRAVVIECTAAGELLVGSATWQYSRLLVAQPDRESLLRAVRECQSVTPTAQTGALDGGNRLVGSSPQMQSVRADIWCLAACSSNVLVTGETGTGKELVADLIHRNSNRAPGPLVSINCAAIPDDLLESELFGCERGAFTGAVVRRDGKLKHADGGTIFFDEIGDLSLHAQAKILRAIENREAPRLGGKEAVRFDARVIAATNGDLDQMSEENRFRKDLLYRLSVACIHLPPLRERREDIPELVLAFVQELNGRFGRSIQRPDSASLELLRGHEWPGNIRELRNVLEAAYIRLPPGPVERLQVPAHLLRVRRRLPASETQAAPARSERDRLRDTLAATNWNKSRTARNLQWSRMTLYRKMAKYQIMGTPPKAQSA